MGGTVGLPVKAFLVNRPGEHMNVQKASVQPLNVDELLLTLPGDEKWAIRYDALETVMRLLREHLEHVHSTA